MGGAYRLTVKVACGYTPAMDSIETPTTVKSEVDFRFGLNVYTDPQSPLYQDHLIRANYLARRAAQQVMFEGGYADAPYTLWPGTIPADAAIDHMGRSPFGVEEHLRQVAELCATMADLAPTDYAAGLLDITAGHLLDTVDLMHAHTRETAL